MAKMYVDKKGYKRFADSDKLVHRHVAERKMGGKIYDDCVVHHKNGNKLDNRRSNLQVMKRSSHSKSTAWTTI